MQLVGNEILLVITYKTEKTGIASPKEFNIPGGAATVYWRTIDLDQTSLSNSAFSYEAGDREAMIRAVKDSSEATRQWLLPALLKITDLQSCVEHYRYYNGRIIGNSGGINRI